MEKVATMMMEMLSSLSFLLNKSRTRTDVYTKQKVDCMIPLDSS